MRAIQSTGNHLIAAYDPQDSVGIIDSYFPDAGFFTEYERFDRHLEKLKRKGNGINYLSICSPNYLHDAHIRFGLRLGADVICEKPLVLNPWNVDALKEFEQETGRKIYTILQLRHHPTLIELKNKIDTEKSGKKHEVELTYITSRGKWYYASWKGNMEKSGGIATNIGIHFFDLLNWLFGDIQENTVHLHTHDRAAGYMEFEKAKVKWFLSINPETLPEEIKEKNKRTFRSINIDGSEVEFSGGFEDLHTKSYESILNGNGFGLETAENAIEMVHNIRNIKPMGINSDSHSFAHIPLTRHPFKQGFSA